MTTPSPARDQIALCRYGHSGYQPFCDGTHATIDFDGTSPTDHGAHTIV